jgi:glycosyltransferase involved in cell wall biosynthesis
VRILHVLFSNGFAGSERSTAESCNAQSARHEVMLAVQRSHRGHGNASVVDHVDPAVEVAVIPDRLFARAALARCIDRFRPDVIHCHLKRATRLVARIAPDAATVVTLHLRWDDPSYASMDGIVCNARWHLQAIPADYRGLPFKANNSLVPHRRLAADERLALRESLGIRAGDFLIGGAGRLTRQKGWDMLISAFTQADLPPSAKLVILGEGRAGTRLRRSARSDPRISLPGYRSDMKDVYQALDLFVCPSRFEPLPRVLLEAMDAGTPVIASDADGCRELIEDYGGDMFAIEDIAGLRRLIETHVRQRPPHRQVDLSAHHIEAAATALEQFYVRVIAHRQRSSKARS